MKSKRINGSLVVTVLTITLAGVAWWQRFAIYDLYRLRGYSAPPLVAALATNTTMNDDTRRVFYVYHPEIEDKIAFNDHCSGKEQTIVLGCYIKLQGIYLYNVKDQRLDGILEVTAAHEALHAEYDRLSGKDKKYVDELITQTYSKITDQRIRDTVENYRKNGADTTNELHSILATEVRDLPPELETYYRRYFNDRGKIVDYSEQYEKAFTDRKNQLTAFDTQLDNLNQQIQDGKNSLNSDVQALQQEKNRLDALLASKQYDAYNAAVPGYNAMVRQYTGEANRINSSIDQYNSILKQRNALALEQNDLYKAIDSRVPNIQTK